MCLTGQTRDEQIPVQTTAKRRITGIWAPRATVLLAFGMASCGGTGGTHHTRRSLGRLSRNLHRLDQEPIPGRRASRPPARSR
jgi:hypothetical protein